ncbi:MAG: hypothetical protein HOO06_09805 [Bdellovibrionaceae bacterium]|jgi:hypothetical protein|nr:hypothetical protein [Pseudobdellovibrionaceae bacterium]
MSFKTKLSIILAFFSLCNLSYAQGLSPNQKKSISSAYEGIPLDEILTTASEHFKYKENILSPVEIMDLIDSGEDPDFDYSKLNPVGNFNIWQNQMLLAKDGFVSQDKLRDQFPVDEDSTVEYQDIVNETIATKSGMEFSVLHTEKNGDQNLYRLNIGLFIHNELLTKALLRKIGYIVPELKYLRQVKVQFKNLLAARNFINKLSFQIDRKDPRRWIKNIAYNQDETVEDTNKKACRWYLTDQDNNKSGPVYLTFQDLTIIHNNEFPYNLSYDYLGRYSKIKSRRLLNALLLVYNFLRIPDSVNKFTYTPGRIQDDNLLLPLRRYQDSFDPNISDLRWVFRRIAQLSREDYQDIINQSYYPVVNGSKPIDKILIEKLIGRRNFYYDVLLKKECSEVPSYEPSPSYCKDENSPGFRVNTFVSDKQSGLLKNGVLTLITPEETYQPGVCSIKSQKTNNPYIDPKQWWVGYSNRFSKSFLESPISFDEIMFYLKSKGISNLISNGLIKFNKSLKTDTSKLIEDHNDALGRRQLDYLFENNALLKIPVDFWSDNQYSIAPIISRDLIIGSYQGNSHPIQIADTFGLSISFGKYLGVHGLPFNESASGGFDLTYSRRYTHIKPVNCDSLPRRLALNEKLEKEQKPCLSAVLEEDFSNIFVKSILDKLTYRVDKIRSRSGKKISELSDLRGTAFSYDENNEITNNPIEEPDGVDKDNKPVVIHVSEKRYEADQMFQLLNEHLKVNESFIATTQYGPRLNFSYQQILGSGFIPQIIFNTQKIEHSRIHIFRKSQNLFQVYSSDAGTRDYGVGFNLRKFIPILSYKFDTNFGDSETKIYNYNINPKYNLEEEVVESENGEPPTIKQYERVNNNYFNAVMAVNSALDGPGVFYPNRNLNKNLSENYNYPMVVKHDFNQNIHQSKFLFFEWFNLKTYDDIDIFIPPVPAAPAYPEGQNFKLVRNSSGKRTGVNYERVAFDTLNYLVQKNGNEDIHFSSFNNGNPGNTIFGKSYSRNVILDINLNEAGDILLNQQLNIHHRWKGWNAKRTSIPSLLKDEINPLFAETNTVDFFTEQQFIGFDKLQLYSFDANLYISNRGLMNIVNASAEKIKKLILENSSQEHAILKIYGKYFFDANIAERYVDKVLHKKITSTERKIARSNLGYLKVIAHLKRIYKNETLSIRKRTTALRDLVDLCNLLLDFDGFTKLLNSKANYYARGSATGFFKNDERSNSAEPLVSVEQSNHRGVISSTKKKLLGPVDKLKNDLQVNEGEFFVYWLMRQL